MGQRYTYGSDRTWGLTWVGSSRSHAWHSLVRAPATYLQLRWDEMHLAVSKLHVNNMCVIIPSRLNMTCSCSEMRCISLLERLLVCVRYCTPKVLLDQKWLVHVAY